MPSPDAAQPFLYLLLILSRPLPDASNPYPGNRQKPPVFHCQHKLNHILPNHRIRLCLQRDSAASGLRDQQNQIQQRNADQTSRQKAQAPEIIEHHKINPCHHKQQVTETPFHHCPAARESPRSALPEAFSPLSPVLGSFTCRSTSSSTASASSPSILAFWFSRIR